jgi:hypothetical protein
MEDTRPGGPVYSDEPSPIMTIGKYWVHGFLYQIFLVIALIPILLAMIFLILLISIIGIIVGLVFLFLVIGWVNKMLAGAIWKIDCRGAWTSLTGHGLAVIVALLVISFPLALIDVFLFYNPILYYIVQYGPVPIIQGVVVKAVAKYFEDSESSTMFPTGRGGTPTGPMTTCPYCNAVFPYREIDITMEGTAPCRTCGAIIQDPRYRPGGPKRVPRRSEFDQDQSGNNDEPVW